MAPARRRARSRPPRSGVLVPLFSLRSEPDAGIGEFPDLVSLAGWAASGGREILALLPLGELAPGEASPYSAVSGLALDPIHVRLADVPELAGARDVSPPARLARRRLDREAVRQWKEPRFEEAFRRFGRLDRREPRRRAFEAFRRRERSWLADHALHAAIREARSGEPWTAWPPALRNRRAPALGRLWRDLAPRIRFREYLQFLADAQWREARRGVLRRGVVLLGDLPFAPGPESVDVWVGRALFDYGREIGAPPDEFSATGQRWGLPMYRWERHRAEGWAWFRRRFRRMSALYDYWRVDHVVGFFRTFAFRGGPPGRFDPARRAGQLRQGLEILRLAKRIAGRGRVVAEDLGSIPPFVTESLLRLDVPGYRVLRWEREGDQFRSPASYPECSIATSGTHDQEPLVEWWAREPLASRRELVRLCGRGRAGRPLDAGTREAILELLEGAGSRHVVVPIQDVFGWSGRINLPATVGPQNWSWRLPVVVERLPRGASRQGGRRSC